MFEFSFLQMLVVFVVGLLVLGPERLPRVARQVGWWVGRIRASLASMREELERETQIKEFSEAKRDIEESMKETAREAEAAMKEAESTVRSAAGGPAPDNPKEPR